MVAELPQRINERSPAPRGAKRILVLGATGTVGAAVVEAVVARGFEVLAAVHSRGHRHGEGVTPVHLDLRRSESVERALTGVEELFLLTPVAVDQVEIAKRVIDCARFAGVRHIVRLSSMKARMLRGGRLGAHGVIEEYLEASGLAWTMLRPTTFMQNFTTYWLEGIRTARTIRLPCGDGRVAYVDVRNVASIAAIALTQSGHEGKVHTLTGPRAISIAEVAQAFSAAICEEINYVDVAPECAKREMLALGMPPWMVEGMLSLFEGYRAGHDTMVTNTYEDITSEAPTSITQFARDHAQIFRSHA